MLQSAPMIESFKRLTGRNEVGISASDYKFYSPRHKVRRGASLPNIPYIIPQSQQQTPGKHHLQSLPHQPQFHQVLQNNQTMHPSQHAGPYSHNHPSGPPSHLSEISHAHQPSSMSQHMNCLQPLTGGHVGGRLHMLLFDNKTTLPYAELYDVARPPTPAKFCDECGAPYAELYDVAQPPTPANINWAFWVPIRIANDGLARFHGGF